MAVGLFAHFSQVYVLKHVLHDWGDSECRTILSEVYRAIMDTTSSSRDTSLPVEERRLFVLDIVANQSDTTFLSQRRHFLDLQMSMILDSGKERDESAWSSLLTPNFDVIRVLRGNTDFDIIECAPRRNLS